MISEQNIVNSGHSVYFVTRNGFFNFLFYIARGLVAYFGPEMGIIMGFLVPEMSTRIQFLDFSGPLFMTRSVVFSDQKWYFLTRNGMILVTLETRNGNFLTRNPHICLLYLYL